MPLEWNSLHPVWACLQIVRTKSTSAKLFHPWVISVTSKGPRNYVLFYLVCGLASPRFQNGWISCRIYLNCQGYVWCLIPANVIGTQFYPSLMFYFGGVTGKNLAASKQRTLLVTWTRSVIIYWIYFLISHILSVIFLGWWQYILKTKIKYATSYILLM